MPCGWLDEGADILDIGGESTRPYSTPVSEDEELGRVLPVIDAGASAAAGGDPVDRHLESRRRARPRSTCGAEIINDVTGLTGDPAMIDLATRAAPASARCTCRARRRRCRTIRSTTTWSRTSTCTSASGAMRSLAAGIDRERICLDPGIGFGKTHQHNLTLMANCWPVPRPGLPAARRPLAQGLHRQVLGDKEADRTAGTIGGALALARQGVQILRVHDVRAVREALLLFEACGGIDGQRARLS